MSENIPAYSAKFFSHIPKDWKLEPLKTLVKSDRKITYGIVQPGKHDPGGILLIRGQDYMNGWVDQTKFFRVTPDLHKKFKRSTTTAGDVLLSIAGYTGTVAVVPEWIKEANLTQTTARIACDDGKLAGAYLSYYLQGDDGQLQSKRYTKGSAQEGLNLEDIERFIVCFPPLPEQQKIASILSSVDDVIEKTRAQIDKLKDLKTGMMQELLTKGIGHTEFKDSPVGRIPAEWDVARLDALAKVGSSKRIRESEYVTEGVPFFRSKEVIRRSKGLEIEKTLYISEKRFIEISEKFGAPKRDDILITAVGTIGTVYLVEDRKFYFKDGNLLWLRNIRPTVSPKYLAKIMASHGFQSEIDRVTGGSSQAALTIEKLQELTVVVPPLDEQEGIVAILVSLDEKYLAVYQKLRKLEQLKKALMQDLLTGKVRVNVEQKESAAA